MTTKNPLRILAVDDDPSWLRLLEILLQDLDVIVTRAYDGVAALEALARETFDILITDTRMPFLDGIELSRRARKLYPRLPIVLFFSSRAAPAPLVAEAESCGADLVLSKDDIGGPLFKFIEAQR